MKVKKRGNTWSIMQEGASVCYLKMACRVSKDPDGHVVTHTHNQAAFLLVDSPCVNCSMARTKVTPKKGEEGRKKILETCVMVHAARRAKEPLSPVHPHLQHDKPLLELRK